MLNQLATASVRLLTSYGLACIILVFLLLLTFLGTIEQAQHGLFDVQKKYFESIFLVHKVGGVIPVPLPGGALLMSLFALNLLLGGLVRVRKDRRRVGILIGHTGIFMLLVGSLVKFALSVEGNLMLYEGQTRSHFESYFDWEVTLRETGTGGSEAQEYVIPLSAQDLKAGRAIEYTAAALPFDLTLAELHRHAQPRPVAPFVAASQAPQPRLGTAVDGFQLEPLPPQTEAERNVAGMLVRLRDKQDGTTQAGLLWGFQMQPLVLESSGRRWAIDLHHRRFPLPFAVRLDRFIHEEHPGTRIASDFTSHVTRLDGSVEQAQIITMNEPLRHGGFTLYQSSWGPQDAQPGEPVFSVFSVVRNPADRWPLYACIVIATGLLVHFSAKLGGYLRSQKRSPA